MAQFVKYFNAHLIGDKNLSFFTKEKLSLSHLALFLLFDDYFADCNFVYFMPNNLQLFVEFQFGIKKWFFSYPLSLALVVWIPVDEGIS